MRRRCPAASMSSTHRGATVIVDYGHNPDAIRALVQAVESMPAKRRLVVISGAGDRRDCDLRQQTEILGEAFDEVILYQDDVPARTRRRRGAGPVARAAWQTPAGPPASRRFTASSSPSTPPSPVSIRRPVPDPDRPDRRGRRPHRHADCRAQAVIHLRIPNPAPHPVISAMTANFQKPHRISPAIRTPNPEDPCHTGI